MTHPDSCPVCGGETRVPIYARSTGEYYTSVPCPAPECSAMPVVSPFASLSAGDADVARAAGPARRPVRRSAQREGGSLGVGGCGND